jgi:hypothetical protein
LSYDDKLTYDDIFQRIGPENGKIPGAKAKQTLIDTGVRTELLRLIWSLSDIDKDGALDPDEFALAMHLTTIARRGQDLPQKLPMNWVPPSKRHLVVP